MSKSGSTEEDGRHTPAEIAWRASMAGFQKCIEAQGSMLRGVAALNGEIFDFMAKRFQADYETSKAITRCRDLQELQSLQAEYLSKAASEYVEEGRKLTESATKIAQESAAPFRQ